MSYFFNELFFENSSIYHLVGKDTIDMPIYDLVYSKKNMIDQVHKKNQQDGGKTLDEIVASLNTHLNPLGLRVSFDRNLMDDTLCLHQPEWFTLKEAIEFAHKQESKILKTNLMDDIKKGLFAANEIRWITQVGGRGGYWLITKPAIQRRIEERRRGRGRPKKVIGDNPLI